MVKEGYETIQACFEMEESVTLASDREKIKAQGKDVLFWPWTIRFSHSENIQDAAVKAIPEGQASFYEALQVCRIKAASEYLFERYGSVK